MAGKYRIRLNDVAALLLAISFSAYVRPAAAMDSSATPQPSDATTTSVNLAGPASPASPACSKEEEEERKRLSLKAACRSEAVLIATFEGNRSLPISLSSPSKGYLSHQSPPQGTADERDHLYTLRIS